MNKRGALMNNIVINYAIYTLLVVILLSFFFFHIRAFENKAALWEDYYAKQIVKVINLAAHGEEVYLDVTTATAIALKKKQAFSDIFRFDNLNNRVSVSLSPGRSTSFSFFNDVDVVDWRLETPSKGAGAEINRFYFKVVEVKKNE
jgi:hypothetical protein